MTPPAPWRGLCLRRYALAVLSATVLTHGRAQTASNDTKKSDEVVTLSEFQVQAQEDRGYIASESMTGTRVKTQIKDLPFSVNVLTSEFFDDFAMFELNENLVYISSFNGLDQGGGYNLRGFNQTYQLRDGFFRLGRYGTSNLDRIEVIKGPNAAIYGQSQPGGMINMISKHPKHTAHETVSYSFGSYDTHRPFVESTGPIAKNTYYIVDLSMLERGYDISDKVVRNREAYLALEHQFSESTSLLLTAEYLLRFQHSPVSGIPEIMNPNDISTLAPKGRFEGLAYNLSYLDQNGPPAYQNRGINFFSAVFDTRINDVWSIHSGVNYGHAHNWNFDNVSAGTYNVATNSLSIGSPNMGLIDEVTLNVQVDLLAHYWMFHHKVENRDLFTFDMADYYRWDPTRSLAPGLKRTQSTIIPGQPVDWSVPVFNITNYVNGYGIPGNTTGRWRHNRATDWGDLYRHQSSFFSGKLLTYFGARYDEVKLRMRNYIGVPANAPVTLKDNLQRWSPNTGVLWKATSNISPFVNYSTGYNPQVQNQDAKSPLLPEVDWGYDYGTKFSFLQDRLNITVDNFYIVRKNVTATEVDDNGNTYNVSEGTHLVRGEELEINYRATNNLSLGSSMGHIDSQITNDGYKFMTVGRTPAKIPSKTAAVYGKYSFDGPLNGWSVNLAVSYTGPWHTDGPNAGDTYTITKPTATTPLKVTYTTNYQWAIMAPSATVWNGGIHYTFKTRRVTHTLGFNVNNLFDKFYITTTRFPGDKRSFYFSYKLSH